MLYHLDVPNKKGYRIVAGTPADHWSSSQSCHIRLMAAQATGEQSGKFDARRAFELNLRPSQILDFRVRQEQRGLLNSVLFTPRASPRTSFNWRLSRRGKLPLARVIPRVLRLAARRRNLIYRKFPKVWSKRNQTGCEKHREKHCQSSRIFFFLFFFF